MARLTSLLPRQRRPAAWILLAALSLLLLLIAAYATLPRWLPALIRHQLGHGWTLEAIDIDYPRSARLHAGRAVLRGRLPGVAIELTARDLDVVFPSLEVSIAALQAELTSKEDAGDHPLRFPEDFSPPVVLRPGPLPVVRIGRLQLRFRTAGGAVTAWEAGEVELRRDQRAAGRLDARLPLPAESGLSGTLGLKWNDDSLEARVNLVHAAAQRASTATFRQWDEDGTVRSELHIDAGLPSLAALAELIPGAAPPVPLESVRGRIAVRANFAAHQTDAGPAQLLDDAWIEVGDLGARWGENALLADFAGQLRRQDNALELTFQPAAHFRFHGRLAPRLAGMMPSVQFAAAARSAAAIGGKLPDRLSLEIPPEGVLRIETRPDVSLEFRGAAQLNAATAEGEVDIGLGSNSCIRSALPVRLAGLAISAPLDLSVSSGADIEWSGPETLRLPAGLEVQASGQVEISGPELRFASSREVRIAAPELKIVQGKAQQQTTAWLGGPALVGRTKLVYHLDAEEAQPELDFDGRLAFDRARMSLQSDPASGTNQAESGAGVLDFGLRLRDGQAFSTGKSRWHQAWLEPAGIAMDELQLDWHNFDLNALEGDLETRSDGLGVRLGGDNWRLFDIDARYRLTDGRRIRGGGALLAAGDTRLPLAFTADLERGTLQAKVPSATIGLGTMVELLGSVDSRLPELFQANAGTVELTGQAELAETLGANFSARGQSLDFQWAGTRISGLDFDLHGAWNGELSAAGSLSAGRVGLAAGLDLLAPGANISVSDTDHLRISGLQGGIFDGSIAADELRISGAGLEPATVRLNDIDLGQVLAFIDVGGLSGSGRLEFILPVGSEGMHAYIRGGQFHSVSPGTLRYSNPVASGEAPNIGLAALEDFRYSDLSGQIDYEPDGRYRIGIHLAGSNPELYNGYPISLNLNISGMLPALFEVLFLTGDFDEAILDTVRQEEKLRRETH